MTVSFTIPDQPREIEYFDSLENHAALGMHGMILVSGKPEAVQSEPEFDSAEAVKETYESTSLSLIQKGGCGVCHIIPGIPNAVGVVGPDLSTIGELIVERMQSGAYTGSAEEMEGYLREAILTPDAFLAPECNELPCIVGTMPSTLGDLFSDAELDTIVDYLAGLPESAEHVNVPETVSVDLNNAPQLTEEDFEWAKQTFFERRAGCHGTLRNGATGPNLTPENTLPKGTLALSSIIYNGTPRGMPDWGLQGFFTQEETEVMAKFLQNEPPDPPEMSLEQMKSSWNLLIPPEHRPSAPEHTLNWENFFVVTLRDAGQVAIIDGDNYEVVNTVDTGYAVQISRMSTTRRYVYTIGRDGKLALIDLWMEIPDKVAEVHRMLKKRFKNINIIHCHGC